MEKQSWILCPICNSKTRVKVRKDTELINFPLFCPKCKHETLININRGIVKIIQGTIDGIMKYKGTGSK